MACACCTPPTGTTQSSTQTHVWLLRLLEQNECLWNAGDPSHSRSDTQVPYRPHFWLLGCHGVDFNFVKWVVLSFLNCQAQYLKLLKTISGHSTFAVLPPGFSNIPCVKAEHSHWIFPFLFLRKKCELTHMLPLWFQLRLPSNTSLCLSSGFWHLSLKLCGHTR